MYPKYSSQFYSARLLLSPHQSVRQLPRCGHWRCLYPHVTAIVADEVGDTILLHPPCWLQCIIWGRRGARVLLFSSSKELRRMYKECRYVVWTAVVQINSDSAKLYDTRVGLLPICDISMIAQPLLYAIHNAPEGAIAVRVATCIKETEILPYSVLRVIFSVLAFISRSNRKANLREDGRWLLRRATSHECSLFAVCCSYSSADIYVKETYIERFALRNRKTCDILQSHRIPNGADGFLEVPIDEFIVASGAALFDLWNNYAGVCAIGYIFQVHSDIWASI